MKLKNSYFFTYRSDIKHEESRSANLLVKSGMIKKTSSGIYMFLPLGLKVLDNIKKIVKEEMNLANVSEVLMPSLINEEIYSKSGRIDSFGKDMFKVTDRWNKKYCLAPTHEELFTIAASLKVKSYKDLHFTLYQIQNKYRDEIRPRYGLLRVREFLMKDAYSFDNSEFGLDKSYSDMFFAYRNIFDRMKLNYIIVKSDVGAMGGYLSEEFQAITPLGEDKLVKCKKCSYTSNIDIAECTNSKISSHEKYKKIELIKTPNAKTIKEVSSFLKCNENNLIKSLIYKYDEDKYVMALVQGDKEVNEVKLKKILNTSFLELACIEEIERLGSFNGFVGPIKSTIKIIADFGVKNMINAVCGANKKDYHYINVNPGKDFKVDRYSDIRLFSEKDVCPRCNSEVLMLYGIEIGNIFKLGTKYSELFDLTYLDEKNEKNYVYMGSYGIGIGRCLSAIVEQNNDNNGIIWPMEIAPYKVAIVVVNTNDEVSLSYSEKLYEELNKKGIDVVLDDRKETVGIKFNDMDLIGIPIRITIGSKLKNNIVEFKLRNEESSSEINIKNVLEEIDKYIRI